MLGNVEPVALAALLAGALPMAWLGAKATGRVSAAVLRWVFVGLLGVSCVTLLLAVFA